MSKRIKIEQLLLTAVLIGFLFPLTTSIAFLKLATWNIPAIVLVFWIALRGINRHRFKIGDFDIWDYSILAFGFIYSVMTLLGQDPIANFLFLTNYLFCFVLAIYIRRSWGTIITAKYLVLFSFITIGLESIIGLIQQITGSEFGNLSIYLGETPDSSDLRSIGETEMGRVHGTLGTGNLVGSWINMFLPFVIFSSQFIRSKSLWIWRNLTILVAIMAIVLTISRFNTAIFVGILGFVFLLSIKNNFRTKIKLSIRRSTFTFVSFLLVLGITTTVVYWDAVLMMKAAIEFRFSDTFEQVSSSGGSSSGVAARMEMNKGALEAFIRSPILGAGFKNSRWIWPTVDAKVPAGWPYQPHNVYMIMLVEGGIFLFLVYALLTLYPFYRLWQNRETRDPFLIAFFLSLSACLGIQMIYITFTSGNFTAVYMLIQGATMGYTDHLLKKQVKHDLQ